MKALKLFFLLKARKSRSNRFARIIPQLQEHFYGVTFLVMAPDHDLVPRIVAPEHYTDVMQYQDQFNSMTGTERLANMHEKTGIFTGSYAVHPLTKKPIPIYLANYVLKEYGTGIVMGVPAHDQRDFEFAQKYGLLIQQVVSSPTALS